MINVSTAVATNYNNIDLENSILILGAADTNYKENIITKFNSLLEVEDCYGDNSDLTLAYKEAISLKAENVYLCNCFKVTDYITIINTLIDIDFEYIVPLFSFSDSFTTSDNNHMYLSEFYSNMLSDNISQLIITEKHASLYENIDSYIKTMNLIANNFKSHCFNKLYNGENLSFVLNNLQNYKFANVVLASILSLTNLKYYPMVNVGDVVFDLNENDFYGNEIAFYSYNNLTNTTIENFKNFKYKAAPEKYVLIHLIKQKVLRSLNLDEYKGKLFTPYLQIALSNSINSIMQKHVGNIIESYQLGDIDYIKEKDNTVTIYLNINIKPYNSIEEINIRLEM